MTPKADVIIFYIREQDGGLIHDQLELNPGFNGENFVSILNKLLICVFTMFLVV